MNKLELFPLDRPVDAAVRVPGSKSYTNRALILAALTKGPVVLKNPLYSEDTEAMIGCLKTLGVEIEIEGDQIVVQGDLDSIKEKQYELFAADSGTTVRFILAFSCIVPGIKILGGSSRLNERPIQDLVEGLRQLGAQIEYCEEEGRLPVKILSSRLCGPFVSLKSDLSSQFCSALLLIAPYISKGLTMQIVGPLISKSYVDLTLSCMREWGVAGDEGSTYVISENQSYKKKEYLIEGDFSSAAYFFAIAALTKSAIEVENLNPISKQGDRKLLNFLAEMGNVVTYGDHKIRVEGKGVIPIAIDMEDCPDQVMTMAVLASFAKGVTKISGVRSLRMKESERILAVRENLKKMGIGTEETENSLTIYGGSPRGALIETYNDHRIAMAFAVAGTSLTGIVICDPEVVNKTFPNFWEVLKGIR